MRLKARLGILLVVLLLFSSISVSAQFPPSTCPDSCGTTSPYPAVSCWQPYSGGGMVECQEHCIFMDYWYLYCYCSGNQCEWF